jgi:WD40 repeat protein
VAAHPLSPRLAFTASSGQERTKLWFWDEDLKGPSRCVDWHGSFWPGQLSPDWSRGVWQLGVAAAVRNLLTDQTEASCTGHEYTIDRAVFTPDGRILTGSRDHDIALWDPVAGLCLPTFAWGVGRNILALSPDGARVAVRGEDGRIELRDNATGSLVARGPEVPARAPAVGFLPDYRRLWIRAADPWELHLWDPAGGETRRLASPGEEFSLIAITPDASAAFISLARGCGQVLRFDGGPSSTSDLPIAAHTHAFSPDGTLYALVHASAGRVDLHDAGGRRLISLAPHNGSAMHAAFLPGGRVVTTAMDASLRLWDASSGALQRIGRWPRISDTYVSPSPDGRWIAAWAGSEGRVYRTDTMEEAVTVPASTVVHGMSFTADSRWVAVFSPDRVRHFPLEPLPFAETVRPRDLKPLEFQRLLAKTPDEAAAYSKAYRARHPNVLAQLTLAERALEDGKAEEAARVAAETIAILPGHPTARRVLAEARALQAAALPEASDARRRMADAAMEELAKAVECGLRQVDRLRASQGFQAVAADARWEGLMAREKEVGK